MNYHLFLSSDLYEILPIIGLIWAILNIILFFKVWVMTDDVNKLKKTLCKSAPTSTISTLKPTIVTLISLKKEDEAEKIINQSLEDRLFEFTKAFLSSKWNIEHPEYLQGQADKIIALHKEYYNMLGKEMPERFANFSLQTAIEIFNRG